MKGRSKLVIILVQIKYRNILDGYDMLSVIVIYFQAVGVHLSVQCHVSHF